jgi:GH18 family chitinase
LVDVVGIEKRKIHIGVPFYGRGWKSDTTPVEGKYSVPTNMEDGLNTYDFI